MEKKMSNQADPGICELEQQVAAKTNTKNSIWEKVEVRVDLKRGSRSKKVENVPFPFAVQEQSLSTKPVNGASPAADRQWRRTFSPCHGQCPTS